jgi:hypothetical protein
LQPDTVEHFTDFLDLIPVYTIQKHVLQTETLRALGLEFRDFSWLSPSSQKKNPIGSVSKHLSAIFVTSNPNAASVQGRQLCTGLTCKYKYVTYVRARLHGASYWLASLTVAGFPTGRQLLDRQLYWPLLFTRCQLLDRQQEEKKIVGERLDA